MGLFGNEEINLNIVFYRSDKPNERILAIAFRDGAYCHGHTLDVRRTDEYTDPTDDTDVAVVVGVKGVSKKILSDHIQSGITVVYIDKGYIRYKEQGVHAAMPQLWRFSVNAFQPTKYFQKTPRPNDRWAALGITPRPRYTKGTHILFAGKSQKYCNWWRLGDANEYAARIVKRIKKITERPIIYRPKPSFKNATPIDGTVFSPPNVKIYRDLECSHAVVTHGSNASLDAILYGVPAISLGACISNPVAGSSLEELRDDLFFPDDSTRLQWLRDLAYCQFTVAELSSGVAWPFFEEHFEN